MRTLRTQLSLIITLIVLITITVISFFLNQNINQQFEKYIVNQQQDEINNLINDFSDQYNINSQTWNIENIDRIGQLALNDGYIIQIYDYNYNVIWDAKIEHASMCNRITNSITGMQRGHHGHHNNSGSNNDEFISYAYDLINKNKKIGTMVISYYGPYFLNENGFQFLNTINNTLIFTAIIALIISLIISSYLAKYLTKPITKTAYIAKQISEGNYEARFNEKTNSKELNELGTAINYLSDALNEQEEIRKQLTIDIAHELRTPLTTISSYLEAMIEGIWEATPDKLQSCYEEINRLANLIADMEHLTKVESDNLRLNKTKFDLLEIVSSCCLNFELELQKKNIALTTNNNSSFIYADKNRLSQVMTNLISNAIKYTNENGNIKIEIIDNKDTSVLIIEDNGIGIPQSELNLIFERFYRTDKSRNRKFGGAGIGLTIVKSIIKAHNGIIKVESDNQKGSRFIITLPKK